MHSEMQRSGFTFTTWISNCSRTVFKKLSFPQWQEVKCSYRPYVESDVSSLSVLLVCLSLYQQYMSRFLWLCNNSPYLIGQGIPSCSFSKMSWLFKIMCISIKILKLGFQVTIHTQTHTHTHINIFFPLRVTISP